jgi:hypothetical protein
MTMIAGGKFMSKGLLYRTTISILAFGAAIASAAAQFQWPPELSNPSEQAQPAPKEDRRPAPGAPMTPPAPRPPGSSAAAPAAAGPAVTGNWKGELTQVGSKTPYKLDLVINPAGGETKYPDLNCTGKLIRVGASKSYAFFIEVITKGGAKNGGRCPDGTITLARAGNDLALLWYGRFDADTIIAYGTLAKK